MKSESKPCCHLLEKHFRWKTHQVLRPKSMPDKFKEMQRSWCGWSRVMESGVREARAGSQRIGACYKPLLLRVMECHCRFLVSFYICKTSLWLLSGELIIGDQKWKQESIEEQAMGGPSRTWWLQWCVVEAVQISHSVMSNSSRPHRLQHARVPITNSGSHSNSVYWVGDSI